MLRKIACAIALLGAAAAGRASDVVSPAAWRSDIDFLASELEKRHPNLYFQTSRESFGHALDEVKADVETLSDLDITFRLQRAVALIGDAHTWVDINVSPATYFPLRLYRIGGDVYVTKSTPESRGACAMRLAAIDGIGVADVYARVSELVSHENDQHLAARVPQLMVRAELLHFLGVTIAPGRARFTFESGADLDLDAVDWRTANDTIFAPYATNAASPLHLRQPALAYWWTYDAARRLLYVKYNACTDDPAHPFSDLAKEVFAFADANRVDRLVVDLRDNGGGNSGVIHPLVFFIKQRAWLRGRVYALIGRDTFSAAVTGAMDLRDAGATLAGEASGGKPNMYGNVTSFTLPASRVRVQYSTKYFRQITDGDPPSLEPDVAVETTMFDFFAQRDLVLDTVAPIVEMPTAPAGHRRAATPPPARHCLE